MYQTEVLIYLHANKVYHDFPGTATKTFWKEVADMPRSSKSFEERIDEKDEQIQKHLEIVKQIKEQKKDLEKRQKEKERKERTRRLIQIGAIAEKILGRPFLDEDNIRFMNFLQKQEINGRYFTRAMNENASGTAVNVEDTR